MPASSTTAPQKFVLPSQTTINTSTARTTSPSRSVAPVATSSRISTVPVKAPVAAGSTQPVQQKPQLDSLPSFDSKHVQVVNKIQKIPKSKCTTCAREFMQSTLTKRGGICGHCAKKTAGSTSKIASPAKGVCLSCKRSYLKKTLDKKSGICGRCCNKSANSLASKQTSNVKGVCNKCFKEFTTKTLQKYDGACGKCNTRLTQKTFTLPPAK